MCIIQKLYRKQLSSKYSITNTLLQGHTKYIVLYYDF